MNTKYFFFILFTLSNLQLFSQDYESLLKEDSFWDEETSGGLCPIDRTRYQIDSDTIFNGKTYKVLKTAHIYGIPLPNLEICENPPYTVNEDSFYDTHEYIREDVSERKVYILSNIHVGNELKEYTLYDFSLNASEIMTNSYARGGNDLIIESTDFDNEGRKRFHISPGTFYTEGIGSELGINYFELVLGEGQRNLICWGNAQNQNNCATVLSADKHKLSSIKIFPNPVKDILTIKNIENITIKVFSITGSLLKKSTSKSDIEIDLSSFNTGIYILEVSNLTVKKRSKILKL
jgi:hypothetical protein